MCVTQEQLQRRAVRLDAIGKKLTERLLHALRITRQPRHRVTGDGRIENAVKATAFRFLERVIEVARHPWLAVEDRLTHRDNVHDWVDAGLLVIALLHRLVIGKQTHDIWWFFTK